MSKVNWCALQILVETQIEYRLYFLFHFPSENLSEFKKNKFSTSIIIQDQSYKNIFKTGVSKFIANRPENNKIWRWEKIG